MARSRRSQTVTPDPYFDVPYGYPTPNYDQSFYQMPWLNPYMGDPFQDPYGAFDIPAEAYFREDFDPGSFPLRNAPHLRPGSAFDNQGMHITGQQQWYDDHPIQDHRPGAEKNSSIVYDPRTRQYIQAPWKRGPNPDGSTNTSPYNSFDRENAQGVTDPQVVYDHLVYNLGMDPNSITPSMLYQYVGAQAADEFFDTADYQYDTQTAQGLRVAPGSGMSEEEWSASPYGTPEEEDTSEEDMDAFFAELTKYLEGLEGESDKEGKGDDEGDDDRSSPLSSNVQYGGVSQAPMTSAYIPPPSPTPSIVSGGSAPVVPDEISRGSGIGYTPGYYPDDELAPDAPLTPDELRLLGVGGEDDLPPGGVVPGPDGDDGSGPGPDDPDPMSVEDQLAYWMSPEELVRYNFAKELEQYFGVPYEQLIEQNPEYMNRPLFGEGVDENGDGEITGDERSWQQEYAGEDWFGFEPDYERQSNILDLDVLQSDLPFQYENFQGVYPILEAFQNAGNLITIEHFIRGTEDQDQLLQFAEEGGLWNPTIPTDTFSSRLDTMSQRFGLSNLTGEPVDPYGENTLWSLMNNGITEHDLSVMDSNPELKPLADIVRQYAKEISIETQIPYLQKEFGLNNYVPGIPLDVLREYWEKDTSPTKMSEQAWAALEQFSLGNNFLGPMDAESDPGYIFGAGGEDFGTRFYDPAGEMTPYSQIGLGTYQDLEQAYGTHGGNPPPGMYGHDPDKDILGRRIVSGSNHGLTWYQLASYYGVTNINELQQMLALNESSLAGKDPMALTVDNLLSDSYGSDLAYYSWVSSNQGAEGWDYYKGKQEYSSTDPAANYEGLYDWSGQPDTTKTASVSSIPSMDMADVEQDQGQPVDRFLQGMEQIASNVVGSPFGQTTTVGRDVPGIRSGSIPADPGYGGTDKEGRGEGGETSMPDRRRAGDRERLPTPLGGGLSTVSGANGYGTSRRGLFVRNV